MPPQKHKPMVGYKIVGVVPLGTFPPYGQSGKVIHSARIHLTNPNCQDEIIVDRMCIVRTSQIPNVGVTSIVYDDKFLAVEAGWQVVPVTVMKPHESWGCPLALVKGVGPPYQDHALYYIEISWKSKGRLPLIGIQIEDTRMYYDSGERYHAQSQSQMVNMPIK